MALTFLSKFLRSSFDYTFRNAPINAKSQGTVEAGVGGVYNTKYRLVVGRFDRFSGLPSNILLMFDVFFGHPKCPGVGLLKK